MQPTATATGPQRTSCSVCQTRQRSAPRIARNRKTADTGMPTTAAIHIVRRLRSGVAGTREDCRVRGTADSGTTVTRRSMQNAPAGGTPLGSRWDLAHGPDRPFGPPGDHRAMSDGAPTVPDRVSDPVPSFARPYPSAPLTRGGDAAAAWTTLTS